MIHVLLPLQSCKSQLEYSVVHFPSLLRRCTYGFDSLKVKYYSILTDSYFSLVSLEFLNSGINFIPIAVKNIE